MIKIRLALIVVSCGLAGSLVLLAQGNGNGSDQMSDRARLQIEALVQEKVSRSPGRKKIASQLIYGIKMHRGEKIAEGVDSLEVNLPRNAQGDVTVDITANISPALLDKLRRAGARILGSYPAYRSLRADVALDALDAIADFPEVLFIQPMQEAVTNSYTVGTAGVRKSEGDVTHKAAAARNTYGVDGTGVKIGVISDGVRNLAAAQASGDIGPVTVLPGQSGTLPGHCSATAACDAGTAMLEIVHDIAPGAQLFFATALGGPANFAQNIRDLRAAGCAIIVDDVFYANESPFQDGQTAGIISPTNGGIIMQAVNDVTADGALYFSGAGNFGNKNDGTSGVWEGDFADGGNAPTLLGGAGAGRIHLFTPAQTFTSVSLVGGSQYVLNWSDPLGGSANDYDLYALNSTGTAVVAASTDNQTGTQDPFEDIGPAPVGSRLVILKFSGAPRYLRLTTNRGHLSVSTPGQTSGHSTALNAFGVAATSAAAVFPNPFTAANQVETFSSDGPRKLFFQASGTPFTPGNVLASGGISRQKPDITAADGVSVTGAGGFGLSFLGTSAAAPHAAAIAALLKSANPLLTPAHVRDALQLVALDNEAAGIDRDSGYGIVMADAALQYIGASPDAANVTTGAATVSEVGGNANGFLEPGERGTLAVPLLNTGVAEAASVTADLSSTTPGVTITPSATRDYPVIPATNGAASAAPFEFVLQESAVYAANIDFVMTVSYNGVTRSFPLKVPTGRLANISTVLDTTAPSVSADAGYTADTGLQAGRMNFTFPISGCGSVKANPGAVGSTTRRYDAYNFTNTSSSPLCVTVNLTHSATALLYVDAYVPAFVPATVSANFAGDNGGSSLVGAGTTQLFAFTVPADSTFTVVVSETNPNGGLNIPYTLRVTGLPAAEVPANLPPINTVPGTQTVPEDGELVFSTAGSNALSISDPDAGNNPVEVTLTATNGVLSLAGTAGLTFTNGDGSSDVTMTATGSIADINNALNGLRYVPAPDFNGPASLTLTTNDKGNTGTGGAMSDTDTVIINVTAVNDAPVLDAIGAKTVFLGATLTFTATATDIDLPPQTLSFSLTGAVPAGASIDRSTGVFTWTPDATQAGAFYTFGVRVTDSLGGFDEEQITVTVAYVATELLAPVHDGGSYHAGRTIPLKFRLTGAGAGFSSAVARLFVAPIVNGVVGAETAVDGFFRYDAEEDQYIFNWSTKGYAPGTYQLRIDLGDGVLRTIVITLT